MDVTFDGPCSVGPALSTVAMINSARFTGGSMGDTTTDGGEERRQMTTRNLVAGARAVKTESHTLYHTPFYQGNGAC